MLVSIHWVREFCPFETAESPREIGARFSLHAAEVEHVEERCGRVGEFTTARVLEVRPHPNAERLTVVKVDAGKRGSALEVVCGAPNARPGIVVPYAAPGVEIGGTVLREAEIRGVASKGMLCSLRELGVSDDHSGLWELPPETEPGLTLLELYPELRDTILEIDNKSITHRPDLWGHYGIAREFAAIYGASLRKLQVDERLARARGEAGIRVRMVGDGVGGRSGLCPRYCGLQIDGVRIGPSPPWLQHRLLAVGSRPISNIVDVTNYILYEIGQPLHAFDVAKVGGGEIRVRRARPGECLRLIDGSEVQLAEEDCVIADASEAVALAGVMGGASSEISDATTSIFLESANFAPARIRRTSLRVGTRTDSSIRFEKSLDPENARIGILRAARMILDLCPGARVTGSLQDVGYEVAPPIEIRTSASFISERLGTEIAAGDVRKTLESLRFEVRGKTTGEWVVRVPSWRATKDIAIREDLVEEVGRIHGYDRIDPFSPYWKVEPAPVNEHRLMERAAKTYLTLQGGLTEVFTYSMVGKAHCAFFGLDPEAHLKLRNPVSEEMDRMRREVIPMHLEKARENQRYLKGFGFFEVGRVYRKPADQLTAPGLPDERSRIAGLVCFESKSPENFYAVRATVLGLLGHLRVLDPSIVPLPDGQAVEPWAHPRVYGRVLAKGAPSGAVYRIHPATESKLELAGDTIAFDLDFEVLFQSPKREIDYRPPLRYPTVAFDVAVVAPETVPVRDLLELIGRSAGDLLLSTEVFDVFVGGQFGAGKKSVALHLVFGSPERTLGGDEVTKLQDRVIAALEGAGYPLRR